MTAAPHPAIQDADDRGDDAVLAAMRRWLERAVIGANLCPFAKAVHVKRQIRWVVSAATEADDVLAVLGDELTRLADADPEAIDTTLVVLPRAFADFLDFNDFLELADGAVAALGLDGELQVASFHPGFTFGDADPDDASQLSNRAPYPTLHLLREASVDRAVAAFPDADTLAERNIATLQRLGIAGWRALFD